MRLPICILIMMNGLFRKVFCVFAAEYQQVPRLVQSQGVATLLALQDMIDKQEAEAAAIGKNQTREEKNDEEERNKHARDRQIALDYLVLDNSRGRMLVLMVLVHTHENYNSKVMAVSGARFNQPEEAKVAEAVSQGRIYKRLWPAGMTFDGTLELPYLEALAQLMDGGHSHWDVMPGGYHTVEIECLAFRVAARHSCVLKDSVIDPGKLYPGPLLNQALVSFYQQDWSLMEEVKDVSF